MDTKDNILEQAINLFYLKGYNNVGIQEIVESSGITKPTLYYYFGSKKGLLESIINTKTSGLIKDIEDVINKSTNVKTALEQTSRVYLDFSAKNTKIYYLMLQLMYTAKDNEAYLIMKPYLLWQRKTFVDLFLKYKDQLGNMNGRQEQFARVFIGILNEYAIMLEEKDDIDDSMIYMIVHQFMHGIYS